MIGQKVSHYRILEKLGGGGMGVVYKAEDTRLGRMVALKVLPPKRVADPSRKGRFIQEARAASALNHPNIITIHDIDDVDGIHYIAMEYVEGRTLDRLIAGRGLRVDEALKCAVQMAAALVKSHASGIVHRDLKPTNVMVTEEGLVKVLDFGLAKLTEAAPTKEEETTATPNPATEDGTILGTVGYMSPEQAEGKPVDARSDIFSFGSVLYEMLTGQQAFRGDTKASTIAAILRDEPKPISEVVQGLPREVERVVKRCLRKDPAQRFQHMDDLKVALEELKKESDSGELGDGTTVGARGVGHRREVRAFHSKRAAAMGVLFATLVILTGTAWFFVRHSSQKPLEPLEITPLTSYPGVEDSPTFSPDGSQVAFQWNGEHRDNWDIYAKTIGAEKPQRLTTDPADDMWPAWSPDGRQIAFLRRMENTCAIFTSPPLGGTERKLIDLEWKGSPEVGWLGRLSWSPDGKWLAVSHKPSEKLPFRILLISLETLETRTFTSPPQDILGDIIHAFSPDGKTVAFARTVLGPLSTLMIQTVSGDGPRPVKFADASEFSMSWLTWTDNGKEILFAGFKLGRGYPGFRLWRVPASGGIPEQVPAVGENVRSLAVSREGSRLALSRKSLDFTSATWRLPGLKSESRKTPPHPFITSTGMSDGPEFSPDGTKIAFGADRATGVHGDIWICDSSGSNPMQLTNLPGHTGTPRWSADGKQIVFDQRVGKQANVFVVNAEGGLPRQMTFESSNDSIASWSRDGKWIYFTSDRTGEFQIWKMPAHGGKAIQVTHGGGNGAFESLDGKVLYFSKWGGYWGRPGDGIWKIPVGGGEETRVLDRKVNCFNWKVAKEGIYFLPFTQLPGSGQLWSIEVFDPKTGRTRMIFSQRSSATHVEGLAVSPDGRWILYSEQPAAESDIILVENFR